jgi:hypothetical protein
MGLILDSSVIIAAERGGEPVAQLIERIVRATGDQDAALSSVGLRLGKTAHPVRSFLCSSGRVRPSRQFWTIVAEGAHAPRLPSHGSSLAAVRVLDLEPRNRWYFAVTSLCAILGWGIRVLKLSFGTPPTRIITTLLPLALVSVLCLSGWALKPQSSPLEQDWTTWSGDVCLKILTGSPWVATAQPENPKRIRRAVLLSSLLVREAMLRQWQIDEKYDSMSPKKRKEFDDKTATCLNDPRYRDNIVIRVWGGAPAHPPGDPRPGTLIISDRPRIKFSKAEPVQVSECGDESFPWEYKPSAIDKMNEDDRLKANPYDQNRYDPLSTPLDMVFPRALDGKSLFQRGDRKMILDWGEKGGLFTFQLANLFYKDRLDF